MFRAQQNIFDEVIAKATDENLTSENWEYMMDAWEKINESGENGPRDAAAALIKRLAHRNANVQLYTLELANAFSQNCGPKMHRELASRSFTDALLRLANDRSTHATVKSKILERMAEWSEMFSKDPDLGIMEQAFHRLKSQNPNIAPPSKPHKREITDVDRRKEEEELQMALAISLQERQNAAASSSKPMTKPMDSGASPNEARSQQQSTPAAIMTHNTAATVSRVRALYDFAPTESGELAFKKGDVIAVLESVYKDWWKGSLRGQVGIFPLNYVEKLSDPTPEELQKEAQMEADVFAEIKNVEKLLTLLSTSDSTGQDSDEITRLYHQTLAIRPKLIELIGKYSQKKDDFVSLNEKFIKARRDYESLLESSMAAPPSGGYGRPSVGQAPYNYDTYPPLGGQSQRYFPSGPPAVSSPHDTQPPFQPPAVHHDPPYPVTAQNTGQHPARGPSNQTYPSVPDGAEPNPTAYYNMGPQGTVNEYQSYVPQNHPQRSHPSEPSPHQPTTNMPVHPHGQSVPQELATSVYDSPLNDHPQLGAGFPPGNMAPQPHPDNGRVSPSQPPYGAGYYAYNGTNPKPALGGTAPNLSVSRDQTIASPSGPPHPYPGMAPGVPPPSAPYGYSNAPGSSSGVPQPAGNTPQDYYRNSELFLPQGSRA